MNEPKKRALQMYLKCDGATPGKNCMNVASSRKPSNELRTCEGGYDKHKLGQTNQISPS